MIYSNACAYAIHAMARLAALRPDGYALLDELCEDSDLPRHFVAKIFQDLARAKLLKSAKGRGGGFALARSPDKITLYDIFSVIDGDDKLEACIVGNLRCDDRQPCPLHDQWKPIRRQLRTFLVDTTLKKMSATLKRKHKLIGVPLPVLESKSKPVQRR